MTKKSNNKQNISIKADNISKVYKLYKSNSDRVKEAFSLIKRKKYHKDYYALNNISFELRKGESLGIIGRNGAGKSTLLKIIAGVITQTSGYYSVNGRISALIELGAGFNPEFTGVENIYFNGSILGYSKEDIKDKYDEIVRFADIGDYIYQPVKTYSSGMFVRLAFSVATTVNPDILIIDEALSVGDIFFQSKCADRIKTLLEDNTTLIFVSHNVNAVKSLCEKTMLLDKGYAIHYGKSEDIVEKYFQMKIEEESIAFTNPNKSKHNHHTKNKDANINQHRLKYVSLTENNDFKKRASYNRIQSGKADFIDVRLINSKGQNVVNVEYEQNVTLRLVIRVNEDIDKLLYGYHIRNENGIDIIYSDSSIEDATLKSVKKGELYVIDITFKSSLRQGKYNIATVLSVPYDLSIGKVDFCDFIPLAYQFTMSKKEVAVLYGAVHWNNDIVVKKLSRNDYQKGIAEYE
jgi:lipopolysaccharide transport system ATP-binding protein